MSKSETKDDWVGGTVVKSDLISGEAEVVEVTVSQPVVNICDKPDFIEKVVNLLFQARLKGHKKIALKAAADALKVDPAEFDKWASTQKRLARISEPDIFYALAKIEECELDSKEFEQAMMMTLTEDDKRWKSLPYLAKRFKRTQAELESKLNKFNGLVRKVGEKEAIFYGLSARTVGAEPKHEVKEKRQPAGLMALLMLHPLCDGVLRVMNFYGNKLAMSHPDAYAHFAKAQKELSNGIALLMKELHVRDRQLPDIEEV
jgi:hypothetical protein